MRQIFLCWLSLCLISFLYAQTKVDFGNDALVGNGSVQAKNYYLLTLFGQDEKVKQLLEADTVLSNVVKDKVIQIRRSMQAKDFRTIIFSLQFNATEQTLVSKRLSELYDLSGDLRKLVNEQLISSGTYIRFSGLTPKDQMIKAWQQDAAGVNNAIAIYGEGAKPNYPGIDSISFNVNDPEYIQQVKNTAKAVLEQMRRNDLYFRPSLTAALMFLDHNGRNDAGNFEPMSQTVNKAALLKAAVVNWNNFEYSALVVPGEGPETYNEPISPGGKLRCQLAAKAYRERLAPFIIVSGGKVHPYKTKYCEAEEMKKYLVDSLQVGAEFIIMEPHARHTTTNLRNAVRLMIRYHFPTDKPALIVTDKGDNDYIAQMAARCVNELGYVPYKLGKRISDSGLEFFIVPDALQINPLEPLDP